MWMRWAERINARVEGADAIIDVDGARIMLPGGAPLLTGLRDLLREPKPVELLERELFAVPGTARVEETLETLIDAHALVPWELGPELAQLHRQTVAGGEGPVLPPMLEAGRMFREMGGSNGVALPYAGEIAMPFHEVLKARRTCRAFRRGTVSLEQLGSILDLAASAGGDGPPSPKVRGGPPAHRPYPSGGGLYPVEVLIYPAHVNGIATGFYYYQALAHRLIHRGHRHGGQGHEENLTNLLGGHPVDEAAFFLLLFLDFTRLSLSRYGRKAYRLALLEAGHIAQNVLLAVSALGLAALPLCGFDDEALTRTAGLRYPDQPVVYVLAVGEAGA